MNRCQYLFLNNVHENDLMISSIHSAEIMETLLTELVQATWSHMPGFSTTSVETICTLKLQPNHSRNSWPNPKNNFQGHQWAVAATFHSGVKRSTYYGTISLDWVNSNITLQDKLHCPKVDPNQCRTFRQNVVSSMISPRIRFVLTI